MDACSLRSQRVRAPSARGAPQGGQRRERGDALPAQLGAAAQAERGQRGQRGQRRQVRTSLDAAAVLQLERRQRRQRAHRQQPGAPRNAALLTVSAGTSSPGPCSAAVKASGSA